MACFKDFLTSDAGAVTVDWVVLAAAITGLGLASAAAVRTGTAALGGDVETALTGASVASLECLGDNSAVNGFECYSGPTITEMIDAYGYATGGGCWMDSNGNGQCNPPTVVMVEQYRMSNGQTYTKQTTSSGGTTTVTWTDGDGETVDEPPPMG